MTWSSSGAAVYLLAATCCCLLLLLHTDARLQVSRQPDPRCRAEGQFLLHPSNRCKYLRCTNAPTTLAKEPAGSRGLKLAGAKMGPAKHKTPRLYTMERACALGTAMAMSHYVPGHSAQDQGPIDKLSVCSEHVVHSPNEGKDACTVHFRRHGSSPGGFTSQDVRFPGFDHHNLPSHLRRYPALKRRRVPLGLRHDSRMNYAGPRPRGRARGRRFGPRGLYKVNFRSLRKLHPVYVLSADHDHHHPHEDDEQKPSRLVVPFSSSSRSNLGYYGNAVGYHGDSDYLGSYEDPDGGVGKHPGDPGHPDNVDLIDHRAHIPHRARLRSKSYRRPHGKRGVYEVASDGQDDPGQTEYTSEDSSEEQEEESKEVDESNSDSGSAEQTRRKDVKDSYNRYRSYPDKKT